MGLFSGLGRVWLCDLPYRPEKVKKKLKTLKKTLLLKKEGRFSTYLFACCYCCTEEKRKKTPKKSRCKVLPLLQLWWPIPAPPQIPLPPLQLLLVVVNQLSQVKPNPIKMGLRTLWPLSTSAIWPRMSLRPCYSKNFPLRDPSCRFESVET